MINTRVITNKQKKFLEKTLCTLGIDIDQLLLTNNLSEVISENKLLKEQNEILNQKLNLLNEKLNICNEAIESLNIKMQKSAFEQIWGGEVNEENQ